MTFICKLDSLIPDRAEVRHIESSHGPLSIVIVSKNKRVYAYENKCPHGWVSLESASTEINSGCKQYIQCSSHFAQFRMEDGLCVYGPCQGQSLIKLDIQVKMNDIYYTGHA